MASRLSPLGIFVKWLLVPGGLAVVGYFIIGPRVGDQVIPAEVKKKVQEVAGQPRPAPSGNAEISGDETVLDEPKPKNYSAPDVEVTVSPIGNTTQKPKRRRRKKKPVVTQPANPAPEVPTAPPVDNGDGGGTGAEPPPTGGGTDG